MLRGSRAAKANLYAILLIFCLGTVATGFGQGSTPVQKAAARAIPLPAQASSSTLCPVIKCNQPPNPLITGIDPSSAITPSGLVVVTGKHFNSTDGKQGRMLLAIGPKPGTHPKVKIGGSSSFSQPYKEAYLTVMGWSDGHAYGQIPSDISGVIDGGATLQLVRSDGATSTAFPVEFIAQRELRRIFPASDMKTDTCSKNADENQCNSWADHSEITGTTGWSIVGHHIKFLPGGPPESSSDYYSFRLANGWTWDVVAGTNYLWSPACPSDSLALQLPDYGESGGQFEFDWSINCSIYYNVQVFIYGPVGVPWK